jgi:hypothetical protein
MYIIISNSRIFTIAFHTYRAIEKTKTNRVSYDYLSSVDSPSLNITLFDNYEISFLKVKRLKHVPLTTPIFKLVLPN